MGKKLALAMAAAVVCGGINAAADVSPVAAEETAAPEQPAPAEAGLPPLSRKGWENPRSRRFSQTYP